MNRRTQSNDSGFNDYLAALDSLVDQSGRFLRMSASPEPFWLIAYDDVPEPGNTTAFTFGVSSVRHRSWRRGTPEIVMSVNSKDDAWLLSLGAIACGLRGKCPFSLGDVLRFGKPLSGESTMSAFFLFWPTILDKQQQTLQISDRLIIFKQAYPIFDSEVAFLHQTNPEQFFMRPGVDYCDVRREDTL